MESMQSIMNDLIMNIDMYTHDEIISRLFNAQSKCISAEAVLEKAKDNIQKLKESGQIINANAKYSISVIGEDITNAANTVGRV